MCSSYLGIYEGAAGGLAFWECSSRSSVRLHTNIPRQVSCLGSNLSFPAWDECIPQMYNAACHTIHTRMRALVKFRWVWLASQEWLQTLPSNSWRQTLLCAGLGAHPQSPQQQLRLMPPAMLRQLCWWEGSGHLTLVCSHCIWDIMPAHSHTLECIKCIQCWH